MRTRTNQTDTTFYFFCAYSYVKDNTLMRNQVIFPTSDATTVFSDFVRYIKEERGVFVSIDFMSPTTRADYELWNTYTKEGKI